MPAQPRSLLRTRLFPLIFALSVLPVAGIGGLSYLTSLRSVESVLSQQTMEAARVATARLTAAIPRMKLESRMPTRSREVRTFYQARSGSDPGTEGIIHRNLRSYLAWFLDAAEIPYAQVIYLDAAGEPVFKYDPEQVIQIQPGESAAIALGLAFVPGDRKGRPKPGEALRISVQESAKYGTVIRLGRPVRISRSPGQPPGYVLLDVPFARLLPERISRSISLLFVDRTRKQVLYSTDRTLHGRSLAEGLPGLTQVLATAAEDSSGSAKFSFQQEEHLVSYANLKEPAWTAAALLATEPYTAGPRRTGLFNLAITALFVLLSGTFIFLLVRRVQERTARLEEANDQILEETRRKSEFLSRMSHDLRTPMNAIIGYTRILLRRARDRLDERQFRNLGNIQTSADNLLVLINEILDLSRIEAGRIDLAPEEVDLKLLVTDCITSVAPLVTPEVQLQPQLEDVPTVRTDADRLRRVVMNLLGNAVKFTEQGSITVSLRSTGEWRELTIADTGVGIPPEDLPHIFKEFHQVERQVGEKREGTGLGLAIAKKSVDMLGGTISAESEVDKGTKFTLRVKDCQPA